MASGDAPGSPGRQALAAGQTKRLSTAIVFRKSSRFPTATAGGGAEVERLGCREGPPGQEVRSAWGSVTVPGLASAARTAWSRYAFGSTPQSFADSMRL